MSKEDAAFEAWKQEMETRLAGKGNAKALDSFKALVEADPDEARELVRGTLRQSDYTKKTMEMAEARKALEQEQIGLERQKQGWVGWYQNAKSEYDRVAAENADLRKKVLSGSDDDEGEKKPVHLPPNVVTKEELDEVRQQLSRVDNGAVNFTAAMLSVMNRAYEEKISVDPKKIIDRALRDNIDPETAFERETSQTRSDRLKEDQEKREKEAFERGRREALTSKPTPDGLGINSPASPLDIALSGKALTSTQDRQKAALATFLEASRS